MNKRDFLAQGGSALLGSVAMAPTWAGSLPPSGPAPTALSAPGGGRQAWQAVVGERFLGVTALGRPVPLVLHKVRAASLANTDARLDQFTVAFEGPRNLPLPAGLHTLQHPGMGTVSVYLEPVDRGERLTYAAHFSLMA